jgi:5,10-methylenetetrahydromethanopterin reductase
MVNVAHAPVGVLIPDSTPPALLSGLCEFVEAQGFSELWLSEDYFFLGGIASAAIALHKTKRIPIGIGVLSSVARHPAVTAMEIGTLAGAHPGRLRVGIGHGVTAWVRQMGLYPKSPLRTLNEVITSMRRLLDGEVLNQNDGQFHFDGIGLTHPVSDVALYAGVLGPKSLALSGEIADGTVLSIMAGPKYLEFARQHVQKGMDKAGRSNDHPLPTYALYLVDKDRGKARAGARQVLAALLGGFGPSQLTGVYGINEQLEDMIARGGAEIIATEMPDEWLNWFMVAGDPDECAERIHSLHEAGATSVVLNPVLVDDIRDQLQMTSDAVLPQLK